MKYVGEQFLIKENSFRIEKSLVIFLPLEMVGERGPVFSSLNSLEVSDLNRFAEESKIIIENVNHDNIH